MVGKVWVLVLAAGLLTFFPEVSAQCDGKTVNLTADTVPKTFHSPNYPKNYPSNSHCQWLLRAPSENYTLQLWSLVLQLEPILSCNLDRVDIYHGQSNTSRRSRYCKGFFIIFSKGQHLLVVFKSNGHFQSKGFKFSFKALRKTPTTQTTLEMNVAVETTLNALLTDNIVTSWKIAGDGDSSVVVLRLKPVCAQMTTNMADPVLNRTSQIQYFRKKPPSEIRRDQRRAQQQQQRQASVQPSSSPVRNVVPVSDTVMVKNYTLCKEFDTVNTTPQIDLCDSEQSGFHVQENAASACATDCDTGLFLEQPETVATPTVDRTVDGCDTGTVKNYTAAITDRSVQRCLRDKHRNRSFRKVVCQTCDNTHILLCESDDIVLEFSCAEISDDQNDCLYWYVN